MNWTPEQVLALAPDAASGQAGRGVATAAKWVMFGADDSFAWGEAKGSGASPYQTIIDLSEPAFKCSCPSRKFPCKHALGLFLLLAQGAVRSGERPAWVDEWAEKRSARAEKEAVPKAAPDAAAQQKRVAKRDDRIAEGLADCDKWLRDVIRQGLSHASMGQPKHWQAIAARMADAQAPGIRRRLLEMSRLVNSGPLWPEKVLEQAALIHLAAEAFSRIDRLPEGTQADVRTEIGIPIRKEDVLAGSPVSDFWLVAAQRTWEEEKITVQRSWLYGFETGRWAMVLSFAVQGKGFDPPLATGKAFHGSLAFYPSGYPLRALLVDRLDAPSPMPPKGSVDVMLDNFADALSKNPWLESFPVALHPARLTVDGEASYAVDSEGRALPLDRSAPITDLLAITGGRPASIMGEWDGAAFLPLTVMSDGRYRRT